MKICLFTPSFLPDFGGMEFVLDKLAMNFQQQGHKPVIIAQRSRHNPKIPEFPYDVVYYPRPRSSVWLLQYVKHVLMREHKKYRFDIVHSHLAYPNGYIACKLRKKLGVPVIITSHKGDIIPQSRYRQRLITRRRMCWALMEADAATGVSSNLKDIIDELTDNRANSYFIPNGVDLPRDYPGSMPKSCSEIVGRDFMLTLGRLHHYKGLDVLLKAMKWLCEQGIETPHLVIAGEGREMQNLRQQAANFSLGNKVVFAGAVFGDEKHWLLRNCKLFLQPSRAEGMPLTILEAMAHAKCVIGTNISGITELITHNVNGLLVEPDDSVALAQSISLLEKNLINQIEQKAKTFVAKMTWLIIADRYLSLYQQLLK